MKFLAAILLLSTSAFAATGMPKELKCTSKAKSEMAQKFKLTGLTSTRPGSTLANGDQGLMGMELRDGQLILGFSNECDNDYGITISLSQIEELMTGKRKTITGELKYSDVWLSEAMETEEAVEETVEITCQK